jgi:hypothetical protein
MRANYTACIQLGLTLLEVLNPITGEPLSVFSSSNWNTDGGILSVVGIDMTSFLMSEKDIYHNFQEKLNAFLQKSEVEKRRFSVNFHYIVYSK